MARTTTTITHDDNKPLEITVPRKVGVIPISAVGRLNTMHAKGRHISNIDIVDLMDSLTPSANSLLKMIKDRLDYRTNEARLSMPNNKSEGKSRSYATAALKRYGAVKKLGQRTFIVNPYLIVPPPDYQLDVIAKWNLLP